MTHIRIVCAANKYGELIIPSARHHDRVMNNIIRAIGKENLDTSDMDQGFIDQFGKFYTREEALEIVKENGQPFDEDRNGHPKTKLFSEGLY